MIRVISVVLLLFISSGGFAQTQGPPFTPPTGSWSTITGDQMKQLLEKAEELGIEIKLSKGTYTRLGAGDICTMGNGEWLLDYFGFDLTLSSIGSFFGLCMSPDDLLQKYLNQLSGRIGGLCSGWEREWTTEDGVKAKTVCTFQNPFTEVELSCDGVIDICEMLNPEIRIWKNSDGTYDINAVYDLPGCTCQTSFL